MMNLNHYQLNTVYRNDLLQQAAKRRLVRDAQRAPQHGAAPLRPFARLRAQMHRQMERWEQPTAEDYAQTQVLEAGR